MGIAAFLVSASFLLVRTRFFIVVMILGFITGISPFVFSVVKESRISNEKVEMFMEFARNLAEGVKMGTPVSQCILHLGDKDYGDLSPHVKKLASQISLGIPLNFALKTFSADVNSTVISRSLTLIGEAERAGGSIGGILDAVAKAVTNADKLNKERKSTISNLIVQGYIIFGVFMVIIVIMQFQILPLLSGISFSDLSSSETEGFAGGGLTESFSGGEPISPEELSNSFLFLLMTQGFFSGLTIGKLSEGNVKAGIKHSFALMLFSFLFSTVSGFVFGGG